MKEIKGVRNDRENISWVCSEGPMKRAEDYSRPERKNDAAQDE